MKKLELMKIVNLALGLVMVLSMLMHPTSDGTGYEKASPGTGGGSGYQIIKARLGGEGSGYQR